MSEPEQADFAGLMESGRRARRAGDLSASLAAFSAAAALDTADVGCKVDLATALRDMGRFDEAEAAFRAVIADAPRDLGGLLGLAYTLRQRGARADSLAAFEAAAAADPDHLGAKMEIAHDLRELGRLPEAEAMLRRLLERSPGHFGALIGIGYVLRRMGDRNAALAAFEAAAAADASHVGVQIEIAFELRELGRHDQAEAMFRRVLATDPDHVGALLGLGYALRRKPDRTASLAVFERAAAADPRHIGAKMEIAFDLQELQRFDAAKAAFGRILDAAPNHLPARLALGRLLRQRGDRAGALAAFETAIALDPQHTGAMADLASILRDAGRFDDAESLYRRVLGREPAHRGAILGLANVLSERHRLTEADELLRGAARVDPRNGSVLIALGQLARRRRDRKAAKAYFEQATAVEPGHVPAKLELAVEYRDLGTFDRARALIEEVLAADPGHLQALTHRGLLLRRESHHTAALAAFRALQERYPGHLQALVEMAVEHLALGQPDDSEALLQRVLAQDGNHLGALIQSAENAWLAEDSETCLALYRRAIAAHPHNMWLYLNASRAAADIDPAEAETLLSTATRLFGRQPEITAKRVELLRGLRDWSAARAVMNEAADEAARHFALWAQQIQLCLATGDRDGARRVLAQPPATTIEERSQALVYRGLWAEAEWGFDEAVDHYRQAIVLSPESTWAHSEMSRACMLALRLDEAQSHLWTSINLKAARHLLKGWSLNASQNSLGQIMDEFTLDRALVRELQTARALPIPERIERLKELVAKYGDSTAAAITLLIALRQSHTFAIAPSPADAVRHRPIPKRIVQFWDAAEPPPDISRLMRAWKDMHADFAYERFDDRSAAQFIKSHFDEFVLHAFLRTRHPAQRADVFRLAYLAAMGGFYADADDRPLARIDSFVPEHAALLLYQENYGTIGNNFIGARAGHPLTAHALKLAATAINRGDNELLWLCTGPGLLTRAFAAYVAGNGDRHGGTVVLETGQLQRSVGLHCPVRYKKSRKHWSHAAFTRRS